MTQANPFLGARPYGPADDALFFGRNAATSALVEQIDLNSLTILVSPSGIGKTSLLRAAVLPRLEAVGLSPVYLRPDPIGKESDAALTLLDDSLANSIARALLPDPLLEILTICRIRRKLARDRKQNSLCAEMPPLTLGDAPAWFRGLDPKDSARAEILSASSGSLERLSMLARYLRGSLSLTALRRQAQVLDGDIAQLLTADRDINTLLPAISQAQLKAVRGMTRGVLRKHPSGGIVVHALKVLCGLADDTPALLVRPDGGTDLDPRIVLVIDQFEQIFTLGRAETRLRAFSLLATLLKAKAPIHLVLSLRKEWYADLMQHLSPVLRNTDMLPRATFHLAPMSKAEAEDVMIKAPLEIRQRPIGPETRMELWRLLQSDDAIDAVVLSIACHELFASESADLEKITETGVEGLFHVYLERALAQFPCEAERDEALDILGEVAGSGYTRGFVTRMRLLGAPLRSPAQRQTILDGLQRAFLIKGDSPSPNRDIVFDIMHERLAAPVRQIVDERPEIALFRDAAERVAQREAWERGLDWQQCLVLLRARNRITWDARSAGILLASALREATKDRLVDLEREGIEASSGSQPALDWLRERYHELGRAAAAPPPSMTPEEVTAFTAKRIATSWWMNAAEIRVRLEQAPDPAADELALRSLLHGRPGWLRNELTRLGYRVAFGGASSNPPTDIGIEAHDG